MTSHFLSNNPGFRLSGPRFATDLASGGAAVAERPEVEETEMSQNTTPTIENEVAVDVEAETETEVANAAPVVAVVEPVEAAVEAEPEVEEETGPTFADLGLGEALLESITAVGYKKPTEIQMAAIPVLLDGKDVIAQAQTGSGKTAAFGLPIIETIDSRDRRIQAMVLCPTRELAIQVSEALENLGRHKRIETLAIYGGQPYERQFRGLQRGVHIVVGTPGRVMDHMRRGTLHLDDLKFFVLDEADEMLDMGFVDDIETILKQVPEERQTALFSATMPPRIADLANTYMNNPQRISVRGKQMTVAEINQSSYEFPRGRKVEALARILEAENPTSAIIFCRTKRSVDELGETLNSRGFSAEMIHGDLSQSQRDRVMKRFRGGLAHILIATDVAARGLDIPECSHVINYDAPEAAETYVHRIGRTGRAGRGGEAITLVSPREFRWLRQVERITRAPIVAKRLPSQEDVNKRRFEMLKTLMRTAVEDEGSYEPYLQPVQELLEDLDPAKLAGALLKLYAEETGRTMVPEGRRDELANFGGNSGNMQMNDRGPRDSGPRQGGPRGGGATEAGMSRLFVNIGHNFRIRPQDFVGAIANEANIPGRAIGAIDIHDTFSFVDVPTEMSQRVIEAMNAASIKGRPVNVEVASESAMAGAAASGGGRGPRPSGPRSGGGGGGFRSGPRNSGGGGGFRGGSRDSGPRSGGFNRGPRRG